MRCSETDAVFKQRNALLLDKASTHCDSKKVRSGLVCERVLLESVAEDTKKTFNGMPIPGVCALADLYGFDIIVVPTRSFDHDPLDCGISSAVKTAVRSMGWYVRSGRGMAKRWAAAWSQVVTEPLVKHCYHVAGLKL